jgi:hypothetical protein
METAGSILEMKKDGDFGTLLHEFVSIDIFITCVLN